MSLELQTDTEVITSTSVNARGDTHGNLCVIPPVSAFPKHEYLTTLGTNAGNLNLNSNFASLTEVFHLATAEFRVYSLVITISSAAKVNQDGYGSIAGGLTNGFNFYYKPSGGANQPLSAHTIKTNDDFCVITPDFRITSFEGTAQTINITINIKELFGAPLILNTGDKFLINLQDNFSTLLHHSFVLNGLFFPS